MEAFGIYGYIIQASVIIIISYFFSLFSKKTGIPSVLMLIFLGLGIQELSILLGHENINFFPILEVLGIVGLIMIVLEASLDLELKREKWPIIWKSLVIAFISIVLSSILIAFIILAFIEIPYLQALLNALPLSIMSSAIVIPSIQSLSDQAKEFMIYESTFSDILGIIFFYMLLGRVEHPEGDTILLLQISANLIITIIVSFIVSYLIIVLFQKINCKNKHFLLIAVLLLFYSVSKLFHLSSLLIILVFGLIIKNRHIFFRSFLKKYIIEERIEPVYREFKLVTEESSFLVRTFFFVIFGITITLSALFNAQVLLISSSIILILYVLRFVILRLFFKKDLIPILFIAPRGLITILLFYGIPNEFKHDDFNSGILLFTIIVSCVIMAVALIFQKRKKATYRIPVKIKTIKNQQNN